MDTQGIIKRQIEKIGSTVELRDGAWSSVPYRAVISPLWRKKSSEFEEKLTELGADISEYYLYIGGADHNITALSDEAVLICGGKAYEFKHGDSRASADRTLYYIGILRKLRGGNFED